MLIRAFSLTFCLLLTTEIHAKSGRRKGELKEPLVDWNGKWFPFDLKKPRTITTGKTQSDTAADKDNSNTIDDWNLKWFPFTPSNKLHLKKAKPVCDDGKQSIEVDFDPYDKRNALQYHCLSSNHSLYKPNFAVEALLEEQFIPPAFTPPIKCLNESISYEFPLNTYGAFRPVPPQYGTYLYLPAQRWLHSISKGAIIMLYHPCASPLQVKILQDTLRSCLYRHIITPNQALSAQRPLALLAWGKILQMSVVDEKQVVDFIKTHAKRGPVPFETNFGSKGSYVAGLVWEAKLITDIEDTEICGYKEM